MKNWRLWLLRIYIVGACAYFIYDALRCGDPWVAFIGIGALLLGIAVIMPPIFKQAFLKAVPADAVPVPVSGDDFPLLDCANLAKATAELQELDFTRLCDYTLNKDAVKISTAFSRVMLHDEQNCIVVINQYFQCGKAWPISVHFQSFFGNGPQRATFQAKNPAPLPFPGAAREETLADVEFWVYVTHNQRSHWQSRLWRHPKVLTRRMPGALASQLWRQHLIDREKIAARLELQLARDLSIEHYFTWSHWLRGAYRQQFRHTNFYLALPRAFFDRSNEWWGELGQIEPF